MVNVTTQAVNKVLVPRVELVGGAGSSSGVGGGASGSSLGNSECILGRQFL